MGTLETHTQELMETSSGQAKYEHQHKAIVWRVPRLPKHGQGKVGGFFTLAFPKDRSASFFF